MPEEVSWNTFTITCLCLYKGSYQFYHLRMDTMPSKLGKLTLAVNCVAQKPLCFRKQEKDDFQPLLPFLNLKPKLK